MLYLHFLSTEYILKKMACQNGTRTKYFRIIQEIRPKRLVTGLKPPTGHMNTISHTHNHKCFGGRNDLVFFLVFSATNIANVS